MYTLTAIDVEVNLYMVQGMHLVSKNLAKVLVDPGSTHSFVSHTFAPRLGVTPIYLKRILMISTSGMSVLLSDVIYKKFILEIAGRELKIDLVLLDVGDFDVIIGMNWLATHYTTLDCHNKKVIFNIPNEETFSS